MREVVISGLVISTIAALSLLYRVYKRDTELDWQDKLFYGCILLLLGGMAIFVLVGRSR